MDLTKEEIEIIVDALESYICYGYEPDYEEGWGPNAEYRGPTEQDKKLNKLIKLIIKKLKPPKPKKPKVEKHWREKRITSKQKECLVAFGIDFSGMDRGRASDKLTELCKQYKTNNIQEAYKKFCKNKPKSKYVYDHNTESWEPDDFFDDYWNGANYDGWQDDSPF